VCVKAENDSFYHPYIKGGAMLLMYTPVRGGGASPDAWPRGWDDIIGGVLFGFFFFILMLALVCGFFALHAVIVIALAETNNDVVLAACGGDSRTVWAVLISELVVTWGIFLGFWAVYNKKDADSAKNARVWTAVVCYFVFSVVILICHVTCRYAMGRPVCMDALRAHSFGMERALLVDLFDVFYAVHWFAVVGTIIVFGVRNCCESSDARR
jgi:hypothetical protein